MRTLISDIATIHSGYSLRQTKANQSAPNAVWVMPSNVAEQTFPVCPSIAVKFAKNITVLREDDVLLTNRGYFKATLFGKTSVPALASSGIWIIRPDQSKLHPGYLVLWLNSSPGQKAINTVLNNFTTIKFIRKEDVENLLIPLPSLEKQAELAKLYNCLMQQQKLQTRRLNLFSQLLEAKLGDL